MKIKEYILYFSSCLFMANCDPHDGKLILINTTSDTIYYSVAYCRDSILNYPIFENNGKIDFLYSNYMNPKEEINIPVMGKWEYFINECRDSSLRIFFFNENLIKTVGKDSIMKYQLYTKFKKLKVMDLEKLKWRVVYQ